MRPLIDLYYSYFFNAAGTGYIVRIYIKKSKALLTHTFDIERRLRYRKLFDLFLMQRISEN